MKRQRGQSMVEFAFIAPMVFLTIFGMIYGGIMFMDYMHYSNAVRTAARQIAVAQKEDTREKMITSQKTWLESLWSGNEAENKPAVVVKFYKPTPVITIEENYEEDDTEKKDPVSRDVVITVTFVRSDDIPYILYKLQFPPKKIKAIEYRMRVEEPASDTDDEEEDSSTGGDTDTEGDAETGSGTSLGGSVESAISGV